MSKIKMPVEKSHIMMFARSIGDANSKYYEEKDENVIAPVSYTHLTLPTICSV